MKCFLCPWQSLPVTKLNPEVQAASDVIKGHIEHLCLGDTASALLLLTKQQQIQFVCSLKLGTINQFCLHCFFGEGAIGSRHNSMVCIWQTGLALPSNNNVPTVLCTSEFSLWAGSCLHFPILTSFLWGLCVISGLMQLHDFSTEIDKGHPYRSWASQGCHRKWKSSFQRRHSACILEIHPSQFQAYGSCCLHPNLAAKPSPVTLHCWVLHAGDVTLMPLTRGILFLFQASQGSLVMPKMGCQDLLALKVKPVCRVWLGRRDPREPLDSVTPLSVLTMQAWLRGPPMSKGHSLQGAPPDLFWKLEFLTPAKSSPTSSAVFLSREAF